MISDNLQQLVATIHARLKATDRRIVLAESCTGGLAGAALASSPGISQYFCGTVVTYREPTKEGWLGIPQSMLEEFSAVSRPVTERMAIEVLRRTPEADVSVAITGHLGPAAPSSLDGVTFMAYGWRIGADAEPEDAASEIDVASHDVRLSATTRATRQTEP